MNIHTFGMLKGAKRVGFSIAALGVALAATLPAFAGQASAGQVTTRKITMSSSASGTITAGQNVSYEVSFDAFTAGAIEGIVVDFCASSPLPGTACTAPTGFSVGAPTVTGVTVTGMSGGSWTAASINSGRTLTLKNGSATGSVANGGDVIFTLTTATNPTHVQGSGTFYARILTFAVDTDIDTWDNTADGSATANVVDSGGVALSTAARVDVTSKVQESITFCVYTGANCAAGGTAVSVGDTNGVLSTSGPFVDITTKYDIATNASGSAVVRFKAPLPTSGSNTLATIGTTATASSAGTTQFGLCTYQSTGSGLTPAAPYDDAGCNSATQSAGTGTPGGTNTADFAFDTAPAATTYGDDLGTKVAGNSSTGIIAFVGNTSPTQAAGIYTSNFNFIATGTY